MIPKIILSDSQPDQQVQQLQRDEQGPQESEQDEEPTKDVGRRRSEETTPERTSTEYRRLRPSKGEEHPMG